MRELPDLIATIIKRVLLWVSISALLFLFVWYAWRILFLGFTGLLIAITLHTFNSWIGKHLHLAPKRAYAVTLLALALLVGLVAWLIVPNVIAQMAEIVRTIPDSLQQAQTWLNRSRWGRYVVEFVMHTMHNSAPGQKLQLMATKFIHTGAGVIVVAVVGFYGALDPAAYTGAILKLIPIGYRAQCQKVGEDIIYTLRWWLLGQFVLMLVLGITSIVGLYLLGVPLAFTLGLFTGVMIFIPYLGAFLSEIPAVLVALKIGPLTMLYVVLLYLAIHGIEAYFLTPIVQRRAVRLLPIFTVLIQILMWDLAGVLGVIVATPLACVALVLIKVLYLHEDIRR